jgi:hypothetical protein
LKRTAVFILVAAVLFVLTISGCSKPVSPCATSTLPPPTLTTSARPIEIVTATGPLEPITPAGPTVEITVKNVSNEPVIFVELTLDAGGDFVFDFDICPARPLGPGQSISARRVLIGGGFGDLPLPVSIAGRLEGNVAFFYTRSVAITSPPGSD